MYGICFHTFILLNIIPDQSKETKKYPILSRYIDFSNSICRVYSKFIYITSGNKM